MEKNKDRLKFYCIRNEVYKDVDIFFIGVGHQKMRMVQQI